MGVTLFIAPAAAGKTQYVLELARACAAGMAAVPRVIVPTALQRRSWYHRLALAGGAIGLRVLTFDGLYAECLNAADQVYTALDEPVQYRVLRAVVDGLDLEYYAPLVPLPGFISALQQLIAEWKAARIWPDVLSNAFSQLGDEPRLRELAQIYVAYQEQLQGEGWADRAGLAWLAVEALEYRDSNVARDWPLVIADGFDDFTEVQLAMLQALAKRVGDLVVTLTGSQDGQERPLVHRRFCRTRQRLERTLDVKAAALPELSSHSASALVHLERSLYCADSPRVDGGQAVDLIEAPDRLGEVRAALRWLKERILVDGMLPREVALLMRDVMPYHALILQTAHEFRLPVRLAAGFPLASNPAIAALLGLLRLGLPLSSTDPRPGLPRRLVVEAWRSPYFDWSACPARNACEPIGIARGDAERLDMAARWARVMGGLEQWVEGLALLSGRSPDAGADDEERDVSPNIPVGLEAQQLLDKLRRFVQRVTPPASGSVRHCVLWLETLIGSDPEMLDRRLSTEAESTSLRMVAQARGTPGQGIDPELAGRDVAALRALKDVLRGLVWAAEAMGSQTEVDWARFFEEVEGAVQTASYYAPPRAQQEEILVADVVRARGVPFRAVAVLGMAEGEFPMVLREDPFLRDADRLRLRDDLGLPVVLSTESAEAEFFYETVTRASERLLFTRPRLADNGADWQASPFWEQVTSLIAAPPCTLRGRSVAEALEAASWPELMESLAVHTGYTKVRQWAESERPARWTSFQQAAQVLHKREGTAEDSEYNGQLAALAGELADRYGCHNTVWSASRLESYRSCPFQFFIRYVLGLEAREEPREGLDARQLGNIYHRILERVYRSTAVSDRLDVGKLLAALPGVAKEVLDEAPRREGIRVTAWWQQTREEIVDDVRRSIEALHALDALAGFVPLKFEQRFGGERPLQLIDEGDSFSLRGVIDRVDRAADGRLCIIDYKTAGSTSYTHRDVNEGKKMQLPLYALAARDALGLGEPADGFYWHVRDAKPSSFTLGKFRKKEGRSAMAVAAEKAWETVRAVRQGHFQPCPPDSGCPSYCPAAGFCWCLMERFGG